MIADSDLAAFIERQRRKRAAAGLPETIVDADALAMIAALVARRGGDRHATT